MRPYILLVFPPSLSPKFNNGLKLLKEQAESQIESGWVGSGLLRQEQFMFNEDTHIQDKNLIIF